MTIDTERTGQLHPFEVPPPRREAPVPWRVAAAFLISPGPVVRRVVQSVPLWASLFVPGAAFALFFLQTGLDRMEAETAEGATAGLLSVVGFAYGTVGLAALAVVIAATLRLLGADHPTPAVVSAVALAYSPTLVYVLLGLAANLAVGWRTAVAFGATGVVWAVAPLVGVLRELTGGRTVVAIATATLSGTLVLLGWALLGGAG